LRRGPARVGGLGPAGGAVRAAGGGVPQGDRDELLHLDRGGARPDRHDLQPGAARGPGPAGARQRAEDHRPRRRAAGDRGDGGDLAALARRRALVLPGPAVQRADLPRRMGADGRPGLSGRGRLPVSRRPGERRRQVRGVQGVDRAGGGRAARAPGGRRGGGHRRAAPRAGDRAGRRRGAPDAGAAGDGAAGLPHDPAGLVRAAATGRLRGPPAQEPLGQGRQVRPARPDRAGGPGDGNGPGGPDGDSAERRRKMTGSWPASPAQQGMWLTERAGAAGRAFHMPLAVRLDGPLDVAALEAACAQVARRHPVLGGVLAEDAGELRVVPGAMPPLGHGGDLEEELARPVDPAGGPAARFTLIREDTKRHVLLFQAHHAVFDGESKDILLRDLAACYAGTAPAPLPLTYPEVTEQQRLRLAERLPDARRYWADRWQDPRELCLPGLSGVSVAAAPGAALDFAVEDLGGLAGRLEVTRFEAVLAAYGA